MGFGVLSLLLSGCSGGTNVPKATSASHSPGEASATAANPCAGVKTTTSIDDVSPACAALWAPYGVTKVPPPDMLAEEHVPQAPPITNRTGGAVSDEVAQLWANANNTGSGWFAWAEANGQPGLLLHLGGPNVLNPREEQALAAGATILQPGCNLYPLSDALYVVGPEGREFFARRSLPTDSPYVIVATFGGPCSATATYPDGHSESILELPATTTVFIAGELRHDSVLGAFWYTDAGGNCQDAAAPPPEWCGR